MEERTWTAAWTKTERGGATQSGMPGSNDARRDVLGRDTAERHRGNIRRARSERFCLLACSFARIVCARALLCRTQDAKPSRICGETSDWVAKETPRDGRRNSRQT